MKARFYQAGLTALAIAAMANTAAAETQPQPAPAQSNDASSGRPATPDMADDIMVVARKKPERLADVPVAVGVVDGDSLKRLNLSGLDQVSRYIPNFNIVESASGNKITVRGISSGTNRGFEQSVGMFVDGIYAGRAKQFSTPFFDIDQVEVLKGPQSVLFGKNTVAGAISIISAKPRKDFGLDLSAGYEINAQRYTMSGILNLPITDNLQARLAVYHTTSDHGFLKNTLTDKYEQTRLEDVTRLSIAWQPFGDVQVNAKYEYSFSKRYGNQFQLITAGPFSSLFAKYDPRFETNLDLRSSEGDPNKPSVDKLRAHNASVEVTVPIAGGILTSLSGYSAFKAVTDHSESDFTPAPLFFFDNAEIFRQFSQELRYASPADRALSYTAGLFFQTNRYETDPGYQVDGAVLGYPRFASIRHFVQNDDTYSAFAELNYRLTDKLRVIGGVRYILENKDATRNQTILNFLSGQPETNPAIVGFASGAIGFRNFSVVDPEVKERQFTPGVTLQYNFDANAMAYAKFTRGFKSGGYDASDAKGTSAPYAPESVSAWEAGFKWTAGPAININLAAYYATFKDLQVQSFNGVSFVTANAAKASNRGVELDARWRVTPAFRVNGSVAYLDAHYDSFPGATCTTGQSAAFKASGAPGSCTQDLSGRPLQDAARWTASVNANYVLNLVDGWRLTTDVGANARTSAYIASDLDPLALQKGYTTVDASIELAAPSNHMRISLIGRNLGDVRAKTTVVNAPFFDGAKGATIIEPRTVEVRASFSF